MHKNQKGFSVLEVFIVVVIIGVAGGLGGLAYKNMKSSAQPSHESSNPRTKNEGVDGAEKAIPEGFVAYENEELDLAFVYPPSWGEIRVAELGASHECQQMIKESNAAISGKFYELTFTVEANKMIRVGTKDFKMYTHVNCLSFPVGIPPVYGKQVYPAEVITEEDIIYYAADDNYECTLGNYFAVADVPVSTERINGVAAVLNAIYNPSLDTTEGCNGKPELYKEVMSLITEEDKRFVKSIKPLK